MELSRMMLGVEPLDFLIPDGALRGSLIGIFGETGTGKSVLMNEIAFRFLQRGEKVLFVLLEDTPFSRLLSLSSLGFDVTEYLEGGSLEFLDCFSYRLRSLQIPFPEYPKLKGAIEVEDPRDSESVWEAIFEKAVRMNGRGVILMDSLTEFLTISPDASVLLDMMKTAKALLCRYYGISLIYSFHFGFYDDFRFQMEVVSDGVIDLRFNPEVVSNALVKQARVRRMSGSKHRTEWITFDVEKGNGVVLVR
ncbi:MAG: RAD55 family ATPase [Candidatus Korarchaeum sp.]|nr:RAD55 family ATPase [Candidatus Korarchaeum sp.]MDW8035756.1 RAD55 family ATPase [Candidatus Korarchaeum sp.]